MPAIDITGQSFGKLTAIRMVARPANTKDAGQFWICKCVCGGEVITTGSRLRAGRRKRGCIDCSGAKYRSVDGIKTPEYESWRGMRERCSNPRHGSYKNYGGRGISVCEEWKNDFLKFREDMGPRPRGMSLDRIDNNGNYNKQNCRWASRKTQIRNSRSFILTDDQVEAIRNLLKCGARQIDIAVACGVARSHIANIATGHSR